MTIKNLILLSIVISVNLASSVPKDVMRIISTKNFHCRQVYQNEFHYNLAFYCYQKNQQAGVKISPFIYIVTSEKGYYLNKDEVTSVDSISSEIRKKTEHIALNRKNLKQKFDQKRNNLRALWTFASGPGASATASNGKQTIHSDGRFGPQRVYFDGKNYYYYYPR